jgi:uncharacterized membrane protein
MYQLSVFLHVLAAMVWVGGMLFIALVLVPVTRPMPPDKRGALLDAVGLQFRRVGWIAVALLVATGIANVAFRGITWEMALSGTFLEGRFGQVLAIKLGVVAVMVAITAYHDFILGPRSVRLLQQPSAEAQAEAERLRRLSSWQARISTLLSLVIVGLGVALVRGLPF